MIENWKKSALLGIMFIYACACVAENKLQTGHETLTVNENTVFKLNLELIDGKILKAELQNISSSTQLILHNAVQHSELIILDAHKNQVTSFDDRSVKKFDNAIYRDAYIELPVGASTSLMQTELKKAADGISIKWGPFVFKHIKPGTYSAYVVWNSNIDEWEDEETGKKGKFPTIWKGVVRSNSIELNVQ